MGNIPKRIAIIYDRVNKWGGAEQVLLALQELFPTAELFTSVYDAKSASWSKVFSKIHTSFLQKIPFLIHHHELFPWLMPLAFESHDLKNFDVIISVTSAECKGVQTLPGQLHLCYCLTPTRYLWSHEKFYMNTQSMFKKFLSIPLLRYLKKWEQVSKYRPDTYIAISNVVKQRIATYYNQDAEIVYPPVETKRKFTAQKGEYFVWIGRLVAYKHPEKVIKLFNKINLPLVIVGDGSEKRKLQKIAKKNIQFVGFVDDKTLRQTLVNSLAFISMHEEDFGISYVEAQAAGKPILGLKVGAVAEIIISNKTGTLFKTEEELKDGILNFRPEKFSSSECIKNAQRFSKERFLKNFAKVYTKAWKKYRTTYMY